MAWNLTGKEDEKPEVMMSIDQLQVIMGSFAKTLAEEMKKPSALEQEKLDQEEALRKRRIDSIVTRGRDEEERRRQVVSSCDHKKENGKFAIGGQVFSDGVERMLCLRCQSWVSEIDVRNTQRSVADGFGNVTEQLAGVI